MIQSNSRFAFVFGSLFSIALPLMTDGTFANDAPETRTVAERVGYLMYSDQKTTPSIEDNLFSMENRGLTRGKSKSEPWSGSYWPLSEGSIANPYTLDRTKVMTAEGEELSFAYGFDGSVELYEYRKSAILSRIGELDRYELDSLAPSEKYDLILGNLDFSFTKAVWDSIFEHKARYGKIKSWEGSCHGWSTAAIQTQAPSHSIEVETALGQKITLFPNDLKALVTALYANSLFQDYIRIDGTVCGQKKPAYDRRTGRMIDPQCQGTDPAVWHTTLVNLMGIQGESFIMNRNNKDEVWNQPLASYQFSYFNPKTGKDAPLDRALITRADYGDDDPYLDWRSQDATQIVGVKMKIVYSKEPALNGDSRSDNILKEKTFLYDLELDGSGKIVGGEWRAVADGVRGWLSPKYAKYPGFIWTLPSGPAISIGDALDEKGELMQTPEYLWSGKGPISSTLKQSANQARAFEYKYWKYENGQVVVGPNGEWVVDHTEKKPQPLANLIYQLLRMAQ